jgi:RND family efflux transporter MFP subunit
VTSRYLAALSIAIASLLSSCGAGDESATTRSDSTIAIAVRVARAELRPIERTITAVGTLAAQEQSTISSKVGGRIQSFAVDLGSIVARGEVLAQIEPRDYELRVQQAEAALGQARAELGLPLPGSADDNDAGSIADTSQDRLDLERLSTVAHARAVLDEAQRSRERIVSLAESGIASPSDLDTSEARYRVAATSYETALEEARMRIAALAQRSAELEIAEKQLADTTVRAPFSGAVQSRTASPGQFVAAGTAILTLVQTDPLRLRVSVPEREAVAVRPHQQVRVRVEGDESTYDGTIARISPALDEVSRTLQVEADIPRTGALRAGLFARAEIVVDEHDEVLCVPPAALVTFAGIEKVVALDQALSGGDSGGGSGAGEGALVIERVVSTGRRAAGCVEIVDGLDPGELVVLDPGGLGTGQRVEVVDAAEAPSGGA